MAALGAIKGNVPWSIGVAPDQRNGPDQSGPAADLAQPPHRLDARRRGQYQSPGRHVESFLHHAPPRVRCCLAPAGGRACRAGPDCRAGADQWSAHRGRSRRPAGLSPTGRPGEFAGPRHPKGSEPIDRGAGSPSRRRAGNQAGTESPPADHARWSPRGLRVIVRQATEEVLRTIVPKHPQSIGRIAEPRGQLD